MVSEDGKYGLFRLCMNKKYLYLLYVITSLHCIKRLLQKCTLVHFNIILKLTPFCSSVLYRPASTRYNACETLRLFLHYPFNGIRATHIFGFSFSIQINVEDYSVEMRYIFGVSAILNVFKPK
jgi:hypothetical protein